MLNRQLRLVRQERDAALRSAEAAKLLLDRMATFVASGDAGARMAENEPERQEATWSRVRSQTASHGPRRRNDPRTRITF